MAVGKQEKKKMGEHYTDRPRRKKSLLKKLKERGPKRKRDEDEDSEKFKKAQDSVNVLGPN